MAIKKEEKKARSIEIACLEEELRPQRGFERVVVNDGEGDKVDDGGAKKTRTGPPHGGIDHTEWMGIRMAQQSHGFW